MKILIYRLNRSKLPIISDLNCSYKIWKPGLMEFRFKRLPKKYIFWWFFHYFGIFKSKMLRIYSYYESQKLAHFFCLVPKHYRWPFMGSNDLQVTYVVTEKDFQGKGIAYRFITGILSNQEGSGDFWYVTDEENKASQALAIKIGFELVGYGIHVKYFGGLIKKLKLKKN